MGAVSGGMSNPPSTGRWFVHRSRFAVFFGPLGRLASTCGRDRMAGHRRRGQLWRRRREHVRRSACCGRRAAAAQRAGRSRSCGRWPRRAGRSRGCARGAVVRAAARRWAARSARPGRRAAALVVGRRAVCGCAAGAGCRVPTAGRCLPGWSGRRRPRAMGLAGACGRRASVHAHRPGMRGRRAVRDGRSDGAERGRRSSDRRRGVPFSRRRRAGAASGRARRRAADRRDACPAAAWRRAA